MNKPIIIKPENAARINAELKAVEGKATQRTTSYTDIVRIIEHVEHRIGSMPKKALEGTAFMHDHRQHFANAYKYTPNSTWIKCEYSKGSWRLIECGREYCPNVNSTYGYILHLSEAAKTEILKRYT